MLMPKRGGQSGRQGSQQSRVVGKKSDTTKSSKEEKMEFHEPICQPELSSMFPVGNSSHKMAALLTVTSNELHSIGPTSPQSDEGEGPSRDSRFKSQSSNASGTSGEGHYMYEPPSSKGRPRKHPYKPGKYKCHYCGALCAKPSVLEKHVRAHTNERPFPCDICKIEFKTKSNLSKHEKSKVHISMVKHQQMKAEAGASGEFSPGTLGRTSGEGSGSEMTSMMHRVTPQTVPRRSRPSTSIVEAATVLVGAVSGEPSSPMGNRSDEDTGGMDDTATFVDLDDSHLDTQPAFLTQLHNQPSQDGSTSAQPVVGMLTVPSGSGEVQFQVQLDNNFWRSVSRNDSVPGGGFTSSPSGTQVNVCRSVQDLQAAQTILTLASLDDQQMQLVEAAGQADNHSAGAMEIQVVNLTPNNTRGTGSVDLEQLIFKTETQGQHFEVTPTPSNGTGEKRKAPKLFMIGKHPSMDIDDPSSPLIAPIIGPKGRQAISLDLPTSSTVAKKRLAGRQFLSQTSEPKLDSILDAGGMSVKMLLKDKILRRSKSVTESDFGSADAAINQLFLAANAAMEGQSPTPSVPQSPTIVVSLATSNTPQSARVVSTGIPVRQSQQQVSPLVRTQLVQRQNSQGTSGQQLLILNQNTLVHMARKPSLSDEMGLVTMPVQSPSPNSTISPPPKKRRLQVSSISETAPSLFQSKQPQQQANIVQLSSSPFLMQASPSPASPNLIGGSGTPLILVPCSSIGGETGSGLVLVPQVPQSQQGQQIFTVLNNTGMANSGQHIVIVSSGQDIRHMTGGQSMGDTSQTTLTPLPPINKQVAPCKETFCYTHPTPAVARKRNSSSMLTTPVPTSSTSPVIVDVASLSKFLTQSEQTKQQLQSFTDASSVAAATSALNSSLPTVNPTTSSMLIVERLSDTGSLEVAEVDPAEAGYVRGRGKGRFKCDNCGIRCVKPCMLRKHIRTHCNIRPYLCRECDLRFKTKGNLTKHMKSKAHYDKCTQELKMETVPTVVDEETQVDHEALERQSQLIKEGKLVLDEDEEKNGEASINSTLVDTSDTESISIGESDEEKEGAVVEKSSTSTTSGPVTSDLDKVTEENDAQSNHLSSQSAILHTVSRAGRQVTSLMDTVSQQHVTVTSLSRASSVPVTGSDATLAPNVNAFDMLQDMPLNLSAGRLPMISASHKTQPSVPVSILHHIEAAIASVTSSQATSNTDQPPSSQEIAVSEVTEGVELLTNHNPAHGKSALVQEAVIEGATREDEDSQVKMPLEDVLGKQAKKRECSMCGKWIDLALYPMHLKVHKYATDGAASSPVAEEEIGSQTTTLGNSTHADSSSVAGTTSTSPTTGSTSGFMGENPRPYKCVVCNIGFRVVGHLTKHYRSKSHLSSLVGAGLLSSSLLAEIEANKAPIGEIIDLETGNVNPQVLSMYVSSRFAGAQTEEGLDGSLDSESEEIIEASTSDTPLDSTIEITTPAAAVTNDSTSHIEITSSE